MLFLVHTFISSSQIDKEFLLHVLKSSKFKFELFKKTIHYCQETNAYFQRHFNRQLSSQDRMEFLNLWYVLIIANDILLVAGSIIKELMERQVVLDNILKFDKQLLKTTLIIFGSMSLTVYGIFAASCWALAIFSCGLECYVTSVSSGHTICWL